MKTVEEAGCRLNGNWRKKVMLAIKVVVSGSPNLKALLWRNIFKGRILNLDFY